MPQRLILIDAHSLCYRSFFAVRDLRTSKGQPTNAVFGFLSSLKKIRKDLSPHFMAACFDSGKKSVRQEQFAGYKVHRSSMPEDLVSQMPIIKSLVQSYHIPVLEKDSIEADDLIASLVKKFEKDDIEIVIVSDDKDMYQLVNARVRIFSSRKEALFGPQETLERFGFAPHLIVDYLALAGDASDNIPGVKGIGEVTAKSLILQFGDLDGILRNNDQLKGKLKEKMEQGRESALMSRQLATLDKNICIDLSLEDLKVTSPDVAQLTELFNALEFRAFADELRAAETPREIAAEPSVNVLSDIQSLINECRTSGRLSMLLEDAALFIYSGENVYSLPVKDIALIRELLESSEIRKTFYDVKEILKITAAHHIDIHGDILDVLLAGYVLHSGRSPFTIEALSWLYLSRSSVAQNSTAQDVILLDALREPVSNALKAENLQDLYSNIEWPLTEVLAQMESYGVCLDSDFLLKMSKTCDQHISLMTAKLYQLAGEEFNLNSPRQLGQVLFDKLKLPVVKRTKTGPSTDEEVLRKLSSKHELPALILEYRGVAKLKSTYIEALPKMVDDKTKCIHCSFNQTGAETGRLSSNNPNLQNIPIRTELGRSIRKAFIPCGADRVLLSADYSQIELRLLAHLAEEPIMHLAFKEGRDIHTFTAAQIFNVSLDDVTKDMRYNAKRINFGIVYGMSAFGLAKDLAIPQKEAQAFIDTYFARYPGISKFVDGEIAKAKERGYAETLFGRRRYLPDIASKNPAVRQFAERQAINTPVQGSAADLIKIAMVKIHQDLILRKWDIRMIITVHDELVFDVSKKHLKDAAARIKTIMESACQLTVALEVTVKAGPNWSEMDII